MQVTDLGIPLPITMGGYPRGKTPGISFVTATTPIVAKLQSEFTVAQQLQDTAMLGTLFRLAKDRPQKYRRLVEAFAKVSGRFTYVGDKDKELYCVKREVEALEVKAQVEAVTSDWFVTIANHCSKALKLHGRLAHGEALLSEAVTTMMLQGSTFNKDDFRIAVQKLWQSDHVHSGCQTLIQFIKEMLGLSRDEYLQFYDCFLPSDQVEISEAYDRARHAIHDTNAIIDASRFIHKARAKALKARKDAEEEAQFFLALPARHTQAPMQRVSTWNLETSRTLSLSMHSSRHASPPAGARHGGDGTARDSTGGGESARGGLMLSETQVLFRDLDAAREALDAEAAGASEGATG